MVAENENAESKGTGDDAASEPERSNAHVNSSPAQSAGEPTPAVETSSAQGAESSADQNKPPVEDRLKKGAKSYLMKVGKLMMMLAILGSLLIGFATYMISSTFNNIFTKLEHPTD